jgi:hypothetical protein
LQENKPSQHGEQDFRDDKIPSCNQHGSNWTDTNAEPSKKVAKQILFAPGFGKNSGIEQNQPDTSSANLSSRVPYEAFLDRSGYSKLETVKKNGMNFA